MGLFMNAFGAGEFFPHRDPDNRFLGGGQGVNDLLLDSRLHLLGGNRLHIIQSASGIDVDVLDTRLDNAAKIALALEDKLGAPERMGHPVATKLVDEHTRTQPGHRNFLQHETENLGNQGDKRVLPSKSSF